VCICTIGREGCQEESACERIEEVKESKRKGEGEGKRKGEGWYSVLISELSRVHIAA